MNKSFYSHIAVNSLAVIVLFIGALLAVGSLFFFPIHGIIITPSGKTPDMPLTGEIGDFVGGVIGTVFSLAATLFVVVTLQEQRWQNRRSIFAQNFYEMLHVHADQVRQLSIRKSDKEIIQGREVFSQFIKHYETIYDAIEGYIQHILNGGLHGKDNEKEKIDYLLNETHRKSLIMRLAYGYFFYGSESYRQSSKISEIDRAIEENIKHISKSNQFYVEGCHILLGHYFRHLYQMIKYVIDTEFLTEEERYIYAKQLRAQMDDDEQLLLYYNAMSEVGHSWLATKMKEDKIKKIEDLCPIARFRMIKNIPSYVKVKGIGPEMQFLGAINIFRNRNLNFFEQR